MLKQVLFWVAIGACTGLLSGSASSIFLLSLDWVSETRDAHLWLLAGLPLAGFTIGYGYHRYGSGVEKGNNLILEGIYTPQPTLPLRMAPLVLFGTLITHLFGGSAGREGTAVQMGAALAAQLGKRWSLDAATGRILLICGVAGGFASVFGTPLAGAVFSLEWLFRRKVDPNSIFPAFWSARYLMLNTLISGFVPLDFFDHVIVFARQVIMWIVMMISPTPGSSGTAEFFYAQFFDQFLGKYTFVTSILWRLLTYYPYLILGAIFLPRWIRQVFFKKKLEEI